MRKLVQDFDESRLKDSTPFKKSQWQEDAHMDDLDPELWEEERLEEENVWELEFERGAQMASDEPFEEEEEEDGWED